MPSFINTCIAFSEALTAIRCGASLLALTAVVVAGCGDRPKAGGKKTDRPQMPVAAAPVTTPATQSQSPTRPATARSASQPAETQPETPSQPAEPAAPPVRRSLADLAAQAAAEEFRLPTIDEGKVAAAGIRKLEGRHITIYTDVPPNEDIAELTTVFDAAVPLYCEYFEIEPAQVADWKIVAYLVRDKERFQGAGLFPDDLPPFPNGFTRGSEFWWYEQPSAYYRRHLMLHEGVHAFMFRWLGGAGPPWYTEGMAELLGTHRWDGGKLELAYLPQSRDEVPYWGRVKIVRDQFAAGQGLQLTDVFKLDAQSHLRNEAYGWCWAAAQFLEAHPLTREAFRELQSSVKDRSIDFSVRFYEKLKPH